MGAGRGDAGAGAAGGEGGGSRALPDLDALRAGGEFERGETSAASDQGGSTGGTEGTAVPGVLGQSAVGVQEGGGAEYLPTLPQPECRRRECGESKALGDYNRTPMAPPMLRLSRRPFGPSPPTGKRSHTRALPEPTEAA